MARFDALFASVARPGDTPEAIAAKLTCAAMPGDEAPPGLREPVITFRHLRTDARLAAIRRYLARTTGSA